MSPFSRISLFLLASFLLAAFDAAAWDRGKVERFATLPPGVPNPEGITVDRNGDVYVTGFNPTGAGMGKIAVFDNDGELLRVLDVVESSSALLGIAFHPDTRQLLVVDIGKGQVWSVDPFKGHAVVFTTIPDLTPNVPKSPNPGPNALGFDKDGNVYISDSFQGVIWRTGPKGGAAEKWASSDLLATSGYPPFGANGLDFNKKPTALFVANTGNDTIVKVPVTTGANGTLQAGTPEVFTNSINGADGLFLDNNDNIWVCANQADEIVVVDKTGKAISKLGDFDGVRKGSPVGLLFPASLARHGDWIYITNLSLDLTQIAGQSVDSQWAAKVKHHTVARIRARILGFERGKDD